MWHRQQQSEDSSLPTEPFTKPLPAVPVEPLPSSATSRFAEGLRVKGEIHGEQDLYIDGYLEGAVRLAGAIAVVGLHGRVTGDIEAREIVVEGNVRGNLRGLERVRIVGTGVVFGDIVTPRLFIEEGARVRGRIDMAAAEHAQPRSAMQVSTDEPAASSVVVQARRSNE